MLGISTYEFLVVVVVAVLVLGPEHLPRVIRTVTKVMSDFRRINMEFQRALNLEIPAPDSRQNRTPSGKPSPSSPPRENFPPEPTEPVQEKSAREPVPEAKTPCPSGPGQSSGPDSLPLSPPVQGGRP
jgi:sec-independent protein translocase protein TatB